MFTHPIVVLDFETTGLNVEEGDRVIEVAAVRIQGGKITQRFESLVNCQRRISRSIASYTHITQDMIDTAPRSAEVFRALIPFIGNDVVFAHNAVFDQAFFRAECERAAVMFNSRSFLCTVKLAKYLFPEMDSHALVPLASSMGIRPATAAHRAAADAELTVAVLLKMVEILCARRGWPFIHAGMVDELINIQISAAA